MAECGLKDPDPLSCSVCLDTLKDPVTIPCGHSYCMGCITGFWDRDDNPRDVHSCPQCRQTFTPRPALNKNTVLVELVDKLMKTTSQTGPLPCAEPGDVVCDICSGRKLKAVKSCLTCLVSYCQTHLQPHQNSHAFKKHKLVNATLKLQDKICPRHDKLLEVYCHTDEQCICLLCVMDEHKGHDIVSAAAEKTEKQKKIGGMQRKYEEDIKAGEEKVQKLRHSIQSLVLSAQAMVDESNRVCKELLRSTERMRCVVEELVRTQQKAAVGRTEEQLKQLEGDLSELKAKNAKLTEFSNTEDHIHYLQNFQSFCDLPRSESLRSITVYPDPSFDRVKKLVSKLTSQVNSVFMETTTQISEIVKKLQIVRALEPKTREEHLEYLCQVTADPDTACQTLGLSQEDRKVEWSDGKRLAKPRAERFTDFDQVLCREALSGTCYWEAECQGFFSIAVAYGSIERRGAAEECKFGGSDQSWSLECSPTTGFFLHGNVRTTIKRYSRTSRVGVYLDHKAGTLSFYSIGKKFTRLHKVQTTFSQPLYAGFRVGLDSYVRICDM